ncbi:hypothetical protein LLL8_12620 [Lactococcus lactis]|nr:hypothetical protein LLL8_12620 [Lactococcus lactis]
MCDNKNTQYGLLRPNIIKKNPILPKIKKKADILFLLRTLSRYIQRIPQKNIKLFNSSPYTL